MLNTVKGVREMGAIISESFLKGYGKEYNPGNGYAIRQNPHNPHSIYECPECGYMELSSKYCENEDI